VRRIALSVAFAVATLTAWTIVVAGWAFASGLGIQRVCCGDGNAAAWNGVGQAVIVWAPGALVAVAAGAWAGRRIAR